MKVANWHIKFTEKNGSAPYGVGRYPLPHYSYRPGKWTNAETPSICNSGWHCALNTASAYHYSRVTRRMFVVEGRGAAAYGTDKLAFEQIRFLFEVTPGLWNDFISPIISGHATPKSALKQIAIDLMTGDRFNALKNKWLAKKFDAYVNKHIKNYMEETTGKK